MTSAREPFPCLIGFHEWKIGEIVGAEYKKYRFECERSACPKHTAWEEEDRFDKNDPPFWFLIRRADLRRIWKRSLK